LETALADSESGQGGPVQQTLAPAASSIEAAQAPIRGTTGADANALPSTGGHTRSDAVRQESRAQAAAGVAAQAIAGVVATTSASSGLAFAASGSSGSASSSGPAAAAVRAALAGTAAEHLLAHEHAVAAPVSSASASSSGPATTAVPAASASPAAEHRDRFAAYQAGVLARRQEAQRRRQSRAQQLTASLDAIMASTLASLGTATAAAAVSAPADTTVVDQVTTVSTFEGAEEEIQCVICVEDLAVGDEIRTLPCGHRYHRECVDAWFQRSRLCCLCKRPIDS